jgi:hypothetical protein
MAFIKICKADPLIVLNSQILTFNRSADDCINVCNSSSDCFPYHIVPVAFKYFHFGAVVWWFKFKKEIKCSYLK